MSTCTTIEKLDDCRQRAKSLFGLAAIRVSIGAVSGVVGLFVSYSLIPWQLSLSTVMGVSVACGIVSLAALAPGFVMGRKLAANWRQTPVDNESGPRVTDALRRRNHSLATLAVGGGIAAMAIRSLGTIALFVGCGYQFAETAEQIAFLVMGWYVILTTIEVLGLVRETRRLDVSQTPLRADVSSATPYHSTPVLIVHWLR